VRLLITATSLRPAYGGPAYSVSSLARALSAAGAAVALWAADGSALDTDLLPDGANVMRLAGPVSRVAAFRPEAIHDNGLWLPHNHQVAELSRALGTPRVVSTRGMLEPWAFRHKGWKKKAAWRLYQRRDLDRAATLHATAPPEAENLRALALAAPVACIPNGVDTPKLPQRPRAERDPAPRTALFLGRIYPVKGLPMLIEAWAQVRPPDWRLVIAGPDEASHQRVLEAAVATAGLQETVSFVGPVAGEAKTALLRSVDLFVTPSHQESFGMAIAEALAHELPVLTTTAVPWPALETRRCGWRAAPTTEALTAALRLALACDCETLRAMGAAGRSFVEQSLSWEGVAARFLSLYDGMLTGAARRPGT
jgi:glycosyltransferase involved in cell wall biosynthesis